MKASLPTAHATTHPDAAQVKLFIVQLLGVASGGERMLC